MPVRVKRIPVEDIKRAATLLILHRPEVTSLFLRKNSVEKIYLMITHRDPLLNTFFLIAIRKGKEYVLKPTFSGYSLESVPKYEIVAEQPFDKEVEKEILEHVQRRKNKFIDLFGRSRDPDPVPLITPSYVMEIGRKTENISGVQFPEGKELATHMDKLSALNIYIYLRAVEYVGEEDAIYLARKGIRNLDPGSPEALRTITILNLPAKPYMIDEKRSEAELEIAHAYLGPLREKLEWFCDQLKSAGESVDSFRKFTETLG